MTSGHTKIVDPAPVCVFAFNRPEHTRRTLDALAQSPLAASTSLTVFIDGPRNDAEKPIVDAVAQVAETQQGFASIELRRRDQNAGLAVSIEEGVSQMMAEHGRAIILEDDILTSPAFLHYMNLALDRYKDEHAVWHIAGYNEEVPAFRRAQGAYLWRFMSCWGWATWADRWAHYSRDPDALVDEFSGADIARFNLDGAHDYWSQVLANQTGELNTWAVFWYATIFRNRRLCLSPYFSYVENIGFDGSGSHGVVNKSYTRFRLNPDVAPNYPTQISENTDAVEQLKLYYLTKHGKLEKLRRKLNRFVGRLMSTRER
ncbi:glycosyltransferase [Ruegeria arenilitoris]|uniref:glycosyltransferase n=1 Tax=Ruegeria arenilitoris TaxID=1173585 RepID=UPI00147E1750|nr:glycosyltransferase [Ruegeria arenilitoris]